MSSDPEAPAPSVLVDAAAGPSSILFPEERSFLRDLMLRAFLLRAAVALLLEWTGYSSRLAPDEGTYADSGWEMALYWAGETFVKPWRFAAKQPHGYFYLNAACCWIFGRTLVPLKLLNALIGALGCRYVYLLARELFGGSIGRRSALLYAFFPSLVLWSALNIRDVWVIGLILVISWKSLQVVRGYSHAALGTMLAAAFALTTFRDYLFFVVALPPLVAFLIGRRGDLGRNFVLALVGGLGILLLVQHGSAGESAANRMSLEAFSKARQELATGGSAFESHVDISTPGKALAFLPLGVAYFLFSPFPWQITSFLKALSLPEMVLVYGLTPAMIRGIRFTLRHRFREALQVLLLTGLLTVSYALGEGNVGTLYRHRAQAITFYLIFAAVGLEGRRALAVAEPEAA